MIVVAWLQWNLLPKVVQDLFQLEILIAVLLGGDPDNVSCIAEKFYSFHWLWSSLLGNNSVLDKRLFEIEIGMKIFSCHGSVGVASFIVLMALSACRPCSRRRKWELGLRDSTNLFLIGFASLLDFSMPGWLIIRSKLRKFFP